MAAYAFSAWQRTVQHQQWELEAVSACREQHRFRLRQRAFLALHQAVEQQKQLMESADSFSKYQLSRRNFHLKMDGKSFSHKPAFMATCILLSMHKGFK